MEQNFICIKPNKDGKYTESELIYIIVYSQNFLTVNKLTALVMGGY